MTIDLTSCLVGLCVSGYLFLFVLLGKAPIQKFFRTWFAGSYFRTLLFIAILWIPYWIYAVAVDSLQGPSALKFFLYLILPPLILLATRAFPNRLHWQEFLVVLILWLPLDFRWMAEVWSWPSGQLAYSLNALVGTCLGVFCFVCLRGLDQVGYQWRFAVQDWSIGLGHFLVFAPLAILLGLASGFIEVSENFASPSLLLLMALGIFVFIAVPEELLFRGIIQNILEREVGRPSLALVITALLFGAAHLNNGPIPDWRYLLLATIAGLFYGNAYLRTRNLMAPAVLHTLVDTAWRGFFG